MQHSMGDAIEALKKREERRMKLLEETAVRESRSIDIEDQCLLLDKKARDFDRN